MLSFDTRERTESRVTASSILQYVRMSVSIVHRTLVVLSAILSKFLAADPVQFHWSITVPFSPRSTYQSTQNYFYNNSIVPYSRVERHKALLNINLLVLGR